MKNFLPTLQNINFCVLLVLLLYSNITFAQIQSITSGDWSDPSTWALGNVPDSNEAAVINANHTVVLDQVIFSTRNADTTVLANGILATSVTLTNNASVSINGSFKLISGGWAQGNNFVYGANSTLIFDLGAGFYEVNNGDVFWPIINGPRNVTQGNISPTLLPAGVRLNNMSRTVDGTLTLDAGLHLNSSSIYLNGTVQINTNGYFNDAPVYGNASTLIYNTGITYNNGNEWNGGGNNSVSAGLGVPNNVTVQNGTQLHLFGARGMAGNLLIKDTNTQLNLGGAVGEDLFLKGNINVQVTNGFNGNNRAIVFCNNTSIQTIQSNINPLVIPYFNLSTVSGSVNVRMLSDVVISAPSAGNAITFGNTNDVIDINGRTLTIGTSGVNNTILGTGKFKGGSTSNLTLLGNGSVGLLYFLLGSQTLRNFTINREAGKIATTLGTSVVILNNLNLTNGNIELKHNFLSLGSNNVINGGSSNSFVISEKSNGGGRLRKYMTAKTTYFFPIGDHPNSNNGMEYSPLSITIHSGTLNSGAYIDVATENAKHPANDSPVDYIRRYWVLNSQNIINPRYSINSYYTNADISGVESNSVAGQWNGSEWLEHIHIGSNLLKLEGLTDFPIPNEITAGNPLKGREINVRGNGIIIVDGDVTPDLYDFTDFGATLVDAETITKTFVIENVGNLPLSINNVTITGANASDFTIITMPSNNIAAQSSSSLIIRFDPSSIGVRMALVTIQSNDSNENPYTFVIRGTGGVSIPCPNDVIIAQQNFEVLPNFPLLNYTVEDISGFAIVSGGNAYANSALKKKYIGQESLQVFKTESKIHFNSIDTSIYSDTELSFDLSALGASLNIGTNSADYIKVLVSVNNGAFSEEVRIIGNNNSNWSYTDGLATATKIYSGSNSPTVFQSGAGNQTTNGITKVKLLQLPNATDVKIVFHLYSGAENRIWSIDNVLVRGNVPGKIWNGSWTGLNNLPPNAYEKVVIRANYNTATHGSFTTCECEVVTGNTLHVTPNQYVDIHNRLLNYGTVIVESDGNLIQRNDASVNTGSITVKRNANLKRLDYNYWGSPVSGRNLGSFSPSTLTSRFYVYREKDDYFDGVFSYSSYTGFTIADAFPLKDRSTYNFEIGKGYVVRAPNNFTTTVSVFNGEFFGAPNNGVINVPVTKNGNGFNLISNPYASNINFTDFFNQNSTVINHIAYFWTNVNPNPEMQGSNYPSGGYLNNYAIYNGSGGVPATGPSVNGAVTPNQYIKVGQGFVIQAKIPGNVSFKNSIRTNNTTAKFFNKITQKTNTDNSVDRFWLQLLTPLNVVNKMLIAYKKEATNDFEIDYDAPHLIIGSDSFYSILGDKKLAIQGRKYPLSINDQVLLGTSYYADGTYTISVSEKEGIFANGQSIYLKDKKLNTITDLQVSSYTFEAQKGEDMDRFQIVYINDTTGSEPIHNNDEIKILDNGENYVVISKNESILEIKLSNALGNYTKQYFPKNKMYLIPKQDLPMQGLYYLRIITSKQQFDKKIIK